LGIENPFEGGLNLIFGGEVNAERVNVLLVFIKLKMEMGPVDLPVDPT
jgi:hypothetical protein